MKTSNIQPTIINLALVALMMLFGARDLNAQSNMPVRIRHLTFQEIALDKNTMNDDHLPMQFLSSIECTFTEDEDETLPVEVYFNANNDLEKKQCCIMKWDASIRRWKKFQGSNINIEREGSDRYFRCTIHESGSYALFKKFDSNGRTTVTLPTNFNATDWKYAQANVGVVCEGHLMCQSIQIPYPELSPAADFQVTILDADSKSHEIKDLKMGEVLPQMWEKNDKEGNLLHLSKKQFTLLISSNSNS
jgi:hypothetical protein